EVLGVYRRFVRPSEEREAVEEAVAELTRLDQTEEPADAATLARLAREALDGRRVRETAFGAGGPVIVDLMEARGLSFDVVLVPGLVEKGFPAPAPADPLLSDRERARLNAAGLALPLKRERAKEERLLFRLAAGAGRTQVVMTYPRLDPSSGRERVPSHFLLRAVEAVTGQRCAYASLEGFAGLERVSGPAFAPAEPAEAWRPAEYDVAVVQRAVAGRHGAEVAYLAELAPCFAAALRAERRRWGEDTFTEYDGVLHSEAALASLAERLGAMPWRLSATALESYAACPFRYFLERVLGVEPLEEPETVTRLSALDRGRLLHDVLYRALVQARAEGTLPLTAEHEEQVLATAREAFARAEAEGQTGLAPVWQVERGGLELELRRFVLDEASDTAGYVPRHFEVAFGQRAPRGEGDLGDAEGVLFDLGDGRALRLRGRIDRVDVRPADASARVLDYKTGSVPQGLKNESFVGGTALQLPLYLRAAQELLGEEATATLAAYRYVTQRGGYRTVRFSRETLEARADELRGILRTIAEGIASGRFFAGLGGGACRNCEYRVVCGVAAATAARFKAEDEAAEPYLAMREVE
ncbi:MAG: PD-(D/E)XK nuclease family protein, partial [bacterium]